MSRDTIINNIRRSLRRKQPLDDSVVDAIQLRLGRQQALVQHQYDEDLTERLIRKHRALTGSVDCVDQAGDITSAVQAYLEEKDLEPRVLISNLELLFNLNWGNVETAFRDAGKQENAIVSVARAAIAETGTLVMLSSPETPITHNYLPDHHIVVVRESTIVKWQEDIWTLLRQDEQFPPRAIAMISGPSKTADVEQTIEYGAHGPQAVHMILWNDKDSGHAV